MKFVKIKAPVGVTDRKIEHPNWFLVFEKGYQINENQINLLQSNINSKFVGALRDETKNIIPIEFLNVPKIDYEEIANKYPNNQIIIRENGTYMFLNGCEIIAECEGNPDDWPSDDFEVFDILVCENDENAEPEWIDFLQKEYPNKKIKVLNHFAAQTPIKIKKMVLQSTMVTFSTTFTSTDWYEKLLSVTPDDKPIIGYCHDYSQWENVKQPSNLKKIKCIPTKL